VILTALAWQSQQESWLRNDGAYIPHPTTWLNGERWEDEKPIIKPKATTTASRPIEIPDWKRRHLPQERKL
jgi:hypothetical protein